MQYGESFAFSHTNPLSTEMHTILESLSHLPDHQRVQTRLVAVAEETSGVTGIFVSGSTARQTMDSWSDLDLGIVFDSEVSAKARGRRDGSGIWNRGFTDSMPTTSSHNLSSTCSGRA